MTLRSVFWMAVTLAAAIATSDDKTQAQDQAAPAASISVGRFPVEVQQVSTTQDGLPDNDVVCVLGLKGELFAGTKAGLARRRGGKWEAVGDRQEQVSALAGRGDELLIIQGNSLAQLSPGSGRAKILAAVPQGLPDASPMSLAVIGDQIYLGCDLGLYVLQDEHFSPVEKFAQAIGTDKAVRQLAAGPNGELAVAALGGLLLHTPDGWQRLTPRQGKRSWSPYDVRGVTFDREGRLWFGSVQGVGRREGDSWSLFVGADGLPFDDFTCLAAGEPGVVWFGTTAGAIRFDGKHWNYRRGRRWLPSDEVRGIFVEANGNAWFATPQGLGYLERRSMTLAEKASFYENEIDKYHRRTPYGYVGGVTTGKPGEKVEIRQHDSDNDGLWTAMYGAGECFAYAATKDPMAKQRATAAFEALKFLSDVTQGGLHPAPKGFPARSILPIDGPNPNDHDSPEHDRQRQERDPHWKVISPRWPVSADGKWYWKSDTSSDELDGHFFLYAVYHDLVAETPEEKGRVKQVVFDIVSHLIEHDYQLIDHDGRPTRWGRFNTAVLEHGHMVDGRGLNSLSILSYLKVAEHITGDEKFARHYQKLVKDHGYAANVYTPKVSNGFGTGNQSDDEMAFMCYYNLLRYETDPARLRLYQTSLSWYWALERPERNPLFNFIYLAVHRPENRRRERFDPLPPLEDGVETLKNFPLDRFNWEFRNSHRLDVIPLQSTPFARSGYRVDGKVIPVEERHFEFWNHNPWQLDGGGNGQHLSDGAAFLLPYYLGKYHGFIRETE